MTTVTSACIVGATDAVIVADAVPHPAQLEHPRMDVRVTTRITSAQSRRGVESATTAAHRLIYDEPPGRGLAPMSSAPENAAHLPGAP